jgi:transcriptional regulator with XRE-family HTH domain
MPMRTLDRIIGSLPADRRAKVTARARKLIAEETALRHLRQARDLTQQSMANMLHIDQASISKIESRSDMLLSTLRSYVEAMGGSLRLVAEFPDGIAELSSLGEALDTMAPMRARKGKAKQRAKRSRSQLVRAND